MMNAFTTAIAEAAQRELADVVQRLAKQYKFNYLEAMRMLNDDDIVPVKNATPTKPLLVKEKTPEPVKEKTPEPVKEKTPEPVKEKTPEPVKEKTPEPVKEKTPEPVKEKTPEPVKKATNKVKKVKYVKPKHPLPWTGKVVDTWCQGLRPNHGLLSQCTQAPKSDGLCTTCFKQMQTNGKTKCGTVKERIAADNAGIVYKNPETGKPPVKFGSVLTKLKTTKEDALSEAAKFDIIIPESEFDNVKKPKGRPPSERPKNKGEDKLDAMIAKAVSAVSSTEESESEHEKPQSPKKETPPPPLENVEDGDSPSVVETKCSVYDAETEDEDEEEATQVHPFEHEGVKYLRDPENNILYDVNTHDAIGVWNSDSKTITPCSPATDDEDN